MVGDAGEGVRVRGDRVVHVRGNVEKLDEGQLAWESRGGHAYFYLNLSTDTYTPVRTQQVMHTS